MKNIIWIIFWVSTYFVTFSNQYELSVALDVMNELEVHQCILVSAQDNFTYDTNVIKNIKKLSLQNIPATYFNYNRLITYILETKNFTFNTGIIIEIVDFDIFEILSKQLYMHGQTYKWSKFTWLVYLKSKYYVEVTEYHLKVPYNCEFIIISSNKTFYKLTEYYTLHDDLILVDYGEWNNNSGLKITTPNVSLWGKRKNFNGRKIKVIYWLDPLELQGHPPCLYMENIPHCQVLHLITGASKLLNYQNYTTRLSQENLTEFWKNNSEWDIFTGLIIFADSNNIGQLFKHKFYIYIKYPRVILRSDYFLQPFHANVWIALILAITIGSMAILSSSHRSTTKDKRSLTDNLFLIYESFCNQSGNDEIKTIFLRTVSIGSRMIAIIITSLFGAVITSYLSVEIPQIPFTDLEGFVKNGQFKLLLENETPFYGYISNNLQNPLFKKIYQNHTNVYETNYFRMNIRKWICEIDNIATPTPAVDENLPKTLLPQNCHTLQISKPILTITTTLMVQENSPTKDAFRYSTWKFYESGILNKMEILTAGKHSVEEDTDENTFRVTELKQMVVVLLIPMFGLILSTFVLAFEYYYKNWK